MLASALLPIFVTVALAAPGLTQQQKALAGTAQVQKAFRTIVYGMLIASQVASFCSLANCFMADCSLANRTRKLLSSCIVDYVKKLLTRS